MSWRRYSAPPSVPGYELLRIVGRGAYGEVWLARSLAGHYCAIKIVWRDRYPHPQPYEHEFSGLESFARLSAEERRQLALLHVGRNEVQGFFYYVMELADSAEDGASPESPFYQPLTLKRWCQRRAPLPLREILVHAIEVTQALAHLHAAGLVHRDIKPANLLVIDGRATLADVGSMATTPGRSDSTGTNGFVPPEGAGTTQADVYSLGKVLYELVTQRDRREFPRLPDNFSQHPHRRELLEFNEILVRACDSSPGRRYRDASALLKELRLLESGGSIRQLREAEERLQHARLVTAVMVLVSVFGLGETARDAAFARRDGQARRPPATLRDRPVADIVQASLSASTGTRTPGPRPTLDSPSNSFPLR